MSSFLFYDIETTGLSKTFDQVLQFCAIRTDLNLNQLERHRCRVRLRPDVIPAPRAVLTHGITPADAREGMRESEAAAYIHRLLNTPDTISLGYNSLGFDDEFLRFTFFRNLLPPYTHQYENGCWRADLLPVALIFRLFKPEVLNWPETDGKPSLKLEHLNQDNDLAAGPAHDAMADVEATVALAGVFHKEKRMWDYLMGCFQKTVDAERARKLPVCLETAAGIHRLGLMIAPVYGSERNFQLPVISMGNSIPYGNQSLWLWADGADMRQVDAETVLQRTRVVRKRFGEPGILLPPHKRFRHGVSPRRWAQFEENKNWLTAHPHMFQQIVAAHQNFRYPEVPDVDLDAALYDIGFFSPQDNETCRRFHAASLQGKVRLLEAFSRPEIRGLALRLLGRNYPGRLPGRYRREFAAFMARVNPGKASDALVDYQGRPRNTPSEALGKIEALKGDIDLSARQYRLLDGLEQYVRQAFNPASS